MLFAVTLFVSASLLFMVQPMVGKLVLPLLGGSPAVWNACMVFFQALLLLGYLYADRLTRQENPRKQLLIHMGVMALPVGAFLLAILFNSRHTPIGVAESLAPKDGSSAILSVLAILTFCIGIPFFVVSTSATLLQKWFTYTGHPSARDPYFLYAASNFGSLISLLGYPIFIEPNMTQGMQTWFWAAGFIALIALIAFCGRAAVNPLGVPPGAALATAGGKPIAKPTAGANAPKSTAADNKAVPVSPPVEPPPTWARMARWTLLAFVPSSLMLGVTFHMTTDIASIPLLWVGPLALYLVTFIIAFARTPPWFRILIGNLAPVMILLLVFLMISGVNPGVGLQLLLYNMTFFAAALMCHYELAHDRPAPQYLTTYFLIMSLGGVLGGIFNSLVAPVVFTHAYEFDLALIVACLMVPNLNPLTQDEKKTKMTQEGALVADMAVGLSTNWLAYGVRWIFRGIDRIPRVGLILDIVIPVLLGLAFWQLQKMPGRVEWYGTFVTWISDALGNKIGRGTVIIVLTYAVPVMVCFFFVDRPLRFALCVAAILGPVKYNEAGAGAIHTERSFFGILKVEETQTNQPLIDRTRYDSLGDEALAALRKAAVPETVLQKLMPLKDRELPRHDFEKEIARLLTAEELKQHETTILKYTLSRVNPGDMSVRDAKGKPILLGQYEYRRLVHGTTLHGTQVSRHERHVLDDFQFLTAMNPWENLAVLGAVQNFDMRQEPLTYYHRTGPVGAMFSELTRRGKDNAHVAMVGLGTGSVSCYAHKGQKLTYYEIDPAVRKLVDKPWKVMTEKELKERGCAPISDPDVKQLVEKLRGVTIVDQATFDEKTRVYKEELKQHQVALQNHLEECKRRKAAGEPLPEAPEEPSKPPAVAEIGPFTYVDDARKRGAEIDFRMGDARLKLKDTDDKYALLLIDAFSSDSIPVHLLTVEAVELYLNRLTDDGILALHISNKFVRLEPVVAAIAKEHNLVARVWNDDAEGRHGKTASSWVVLARKREDLGNQLCSPISDLMVDFYHGRQLYDVLIRLYPELKGVIDKSATKPQVTILKWLDERSASDPQAKQFASWIRKHDSEFVTLMKVLQEESGYGFRPLASMKRNTPLWTDDYADVMRVMMIPELQAVRKFFGLPTLDDEE